MTTEYQFFNRLREKAEQVTENRYHVASLPGRLHKLGVSEEGFPKFFIVTEDNSTMQNLNAELLSVEYNMLCDIIEDNTVVEGQRFTIITLRSENEQLQKMFIDVFLLMLDSLPQSPTNMQLASKIENLISIFSKLKRRPVHKLQGLWAELLLIEQSQNLSVVARAWHTQPDSKYDFTMGGDKVEVKSTQGENRIHRFSLDQLNPSPSSRLLICSVIVRESAKAANGLSVFNLYDKISAKISDSEIRLHVNDVFTETLGSDYYVAQNKYFDYIEACDQMALFEHTDVPKIDKALVPDHVTEVKFSSNLSHLTDIRIKRPEGFNSELFDAIF